MPESRDSDAVDPLSVVVFAANASCAEAARAALDAAGLGSDVATVEDTLDENTHHPVLLVAANAEQIDTDLLVSAVDRDFVLIDNAAREVPARVRVLRERAWRRRSRLANAEQMRTETMELTFAVHTAETIDDLAAAVTEGLRRMFSAHAAAVVIPADPEAAGDPTSIAWTADHGSSPELAELMESLATAEALDRLPAPADLHLRLAKPVDDLFREQNAETVERLFGTDARHIMLVPVEFDGGARGALFLADAAEPARRTEYERGLMSYVAMQVGRAASELWLRDRQQASEEQLHKTSAELQRLVDEMDDLGVVIRSIADAVNVGVIFYDTDNQPKLHNHMVERLLALAGFNEATGFSTHVYGSDRHTRVKEGVNIVSETLEGDQRGLIYWMGDPEGEQRAVVTEAHAISKPNGEQLGSAIVTYDVTDLANAIEIREEYLATVSHELRTPLTSIVGYLDLIDDGYDVEALGFGREFRTIQRSAEQMLGLIRDLLSTSTRDLSLRIEPVDLSALLAQSVSTFRPTLEAAHQTLQLETPKATVLAHLDAGRVRQVVDNLISNATKYTDEGGVITVGLKPDADTVVITVADNGSGISKPDQARLFDRFFRTRDAREAAIQGVGIGLTIVRTIVDAHGGTISVDSEPGRGSTFTVRLPMRAEASPLPTLPLQP
ncbi:cell wall metabolism sensor histidine kinase WalK [Humibacter sp. RRB41]|uniref:sensor histidine kinase n=1 Tax=Humibacter sp. RRB41 TaxID=2919946 RepID=UPI001FAAADB6|nr:HAMP domain-containing sensor histidine kinase [Humibacter sp. RRB41]